MRWILILWMFLSVSSCATTKDFSLKRQLESNNCNQENSYNYVADDIPKPLYTLKLDTVLTSRLNQRDLNIANAMGILDLLTRYLYKIKEVQETHTLQSQIDLIAIRQELNSKIDLASLEISSVAAELDCEEERISQVASYLKENEMKRETRLTVGSIILGSLTAVVTGALITSKDKSSAADYIGIGVGLTDAAIGAMILTNKRKIEFKHPRNVLREIWLATETSSVYPPSIWYYLNYKNPGINNGVSLREQLIEKWKAFGQVRTFNKSKSKGIEIYFSDGGNYSTDQLENRANMYDQIESSIKLMKQDLRYLSLSIENLYTYNR